MMEKHDNPKTITDNTETLKNALFLIEKLRGQKDSMLFLHHALEQWRLKQDELSADKLKMCAKNLDDFYQGAFFKLINSFTIGPYAITDSRPEHPDKIWIRHESGEGGEFSREAFLALVDKFYNDNL